MQFLESYDRLEKENLRDTEKHFDVLSDKVW